MLKKVTAAAAFAAMAATSGVASAADLGHAREEPSFSPPAGTNWILNANNQIAIQFVDVNFDYKETVGGQPFNTEKGWVPGFGVSTSYMGNLILPNFYLNADFAWYTGKTDYVGAHQNQPFGSLKTKDGADVFDFDSRVGKGFALGQNFMATPYFGLGYHDWNRHVNTGEEYSHGYYGAGLLLQWSPFERFVFSASGLIGETFGSQIVIQGDGVTPTLTQDLGDSTIYKIGLSGDYAVTRNIHVSAGVEWVDFKYGHSAFQAVNTVVGPGLINEPDSRTNNVIAKVGVGYSFGASYEPLK